MELHNHKGHGLSMVVVMGATGAGKSHFINKLAGPGKQVAKEGDSIRSCRSLVAMEGKMRSTNRMPWRKALKVVCRSP